MIAHSSDNYRTKDCVVCAAVVAVSYFGSARLGLEYAVIGQTVTLMWPPSGIALAAILICGAKIWPSIALGSFLANAWNGHLSYSTVSVITMGDTLEPLVGAALLGTQWRFSLALDKVRDVLQLLVFAACASTMIGATFGAFGLFTAGEINPSEYATTWLVWWLGDGMGVLVVSPVVLTGFTMLKTKAYKFSWVQGVELLVLLIVMLGIGHTVFKSPDLAGLGYFQTSLSMFPFAIWSALRFGSAGASTVAMIVSSLAIHGTVGGTGPFALDSKMNSLILWCLFADLMAITGLILGAVNCGRKQAQAALEMANETLDKQVRERTADLLKANLELHATLAEKSRLQLEFNQISEDKQKMFGQELHDGLGQQLTGIAFLTSSVYQSLKGKDMPEAAIIENVNRLVDEALTGVRALSRGLYPTALETGGLTSALHHLAEYSESASGVLCAFHCDQPNLSFDRTIELNLYRIAQEAVCNALRHGRAQRIQITLSNIGDDFLLRVDDNGIGLTDSIGNAAKSLGLRSMQSRANLIGASIEFKQNVGGGMSVVVAGSIRYFGGR